MASGVPALFMEAYGLVDASPQLVLDLNLAMGPLAQAELVGPMGRAIIGELASRIDNELCLDASVKPLNRLLLDFFQIEADYYSLPHTLQNDNSSFSSALSTLWGKIRVPKNDRFTRIYLFLYHELYRLTTYGSVKATSVDFCTKVSFKIDAHIGFVLHFVRVLQVVLSRRGEEAEWCFDLPMRAVHCGLSSWSLMASTKGMFDLKAQKRIIALTPRPIEPTLSPKWRVRDLKAMSAAGCMENAKKYITRKHFVTKSQLVIQKPVEVYSYNIDLTIDYLLMEAPFGLNFVVPAALTKLSRHRFMTAHSIICGYVTMSSIHASLMTSAMKRTMICYILTFSACDER